MRQNPNDIPTHKPLTFISHLILPPIYFSFMSNSSNPQSQPPDRVIEINQTSETTSQNGYHKVTFGEVLLHLWSPSDTSHSNSPSPTPFQVWFGQNVYPWLTPRRIIFFSLCLISSLLAFVSFSQTEFYKSSHYRHQLLLVIALVPCHTLWLVFILFFRFCTVGRHHYVLKTLAEVMVLVLVSCLMLEIGHKHQINHHHGWDEVVVLATCVFLDVDAICLIYLLTPGDNCSLLEAIVTLTFHLGWLGSIYLRIFAMCFVFLILFVKNFQWRHVGDAQATSNEQHHLVWVALEAA